MMSADLNEGPLGDQLCRACVLLITSSHRFTLAVRAARVKIPVAGGGPFGQAGDRGNNPRALGDGLDDEHPVEPLRDQFLVDAKPLNKVSGHPFRIAEIEAAIEAALANA